MSKVSIIDPVTDSRWDDFVENHPFGAICHLSGWKQVLEKSFKHMKGYYLALLNDDAIQAALPLYEVKSWLTGNRLVSIPYATICDPLISSGNEMKVLFESALDLSSKPNAAYIEIRTHSSSSLMKDSRLGSSSFFKQHYIPLENDPEQLRKSFHPTWVTQNIKRALKSNLKLKTADNESDVLNFFSLYSIMRKRLGLPPQPYIFFKMLWEIFSPSKRITILIAEHNKKPIAYLILLKFKDRVSAEYAAWDRRYRNLCPNHYLYWEAIKLSYYEGYKLFDLSRTSSYNDNLMNFKSRWGTQIADLPTYYYPKQITTRDHEREKSIAQKILNSISKKTPLPALQLMGQFLYRHMG
jgi:hypothetical protein